MRRAGTHDSAGDPEDAAAAWVFRREAGLAPAEQSALERWQAADPQHAAALARHERAWSALDRPRRAGLADFVLGKLAERASGRRRRRAAVAGAAGAFLIAGLAPWIARPSAPAPPDSRVLVMLPETQTLPDGSIVEKKPGTEITIDFSGAGRRVALLRGEAHFQVAHQSRPFVVTAGNVEFRAVGTAFSVQLAAAHVELLVTEGRVAVDKLAGTPPGGGLSDSAPPAMTATLATVASGNRVMIGLAGDPKISDPNVTVLPREEMAQRLGWRTPRLEFTETPLAEAVALMNQHTQAKLVIEDADLGRLPVSGLFRADRTEAFVRLLEANFNVRAEPAGQTIRLHRGR